MVVVQVGRWGFMSVYVIAEIGINHNGDMLLAKKLIDKAKESGCDAVKFQKRNVDAVYTQEELLAPRNSPWGTTNREQKEGLEFSIEQYIELQAYTKSLNMDFGISCWDLVSLAEIEKSIDVDFHKVASALLTYREFLVALRNTCKPIIVSTGMSSEGDVASALALLSNVKYVLACTSTYPTAAEDVNLLYVDQLKKLYPNVGVGFSNHYNGHDACVGAVALGAKCVEFHITIDRTMYGSDQAASIENSTDLVKAIRTIEKMIGTRRKVVLDSEVPVMKKLRKFTTT